MGEGYNKYESGTQKINMKQETKISNCFVLAVAVLFLAVFSSIQIDPAIAEDEEVVSSESDGEVSSDYDYYKKYSLYLKYEKKQLYKKYKKYAEYKKAYKKCKNSDEYKNGTKKCGSSKSNYNKYKKYQKYGKYSKYNKDEYDDYKNYGKDEYEEAYERYKKAIKEGTVADLGEADLGGDELGPEISVGIQSYLKSDLQDSGYFKIEGNGDSGDYVIKNSDDDILVTISSGDWVKVKYTSDKNFKIYNSDGDVIIDSVNKEIIFESAADGDEMIFDVNKPGSDYDNYRGKIKLRYYDSDSGSSNDRVWVINVLPLEQYVWGMGEITGTGATDYNRVMTTAYRTYGYWKIKYSTKYSDQGFKVDATSGSQIYYGKDWEDDHERIKAAAGDTQGKIVMYKSDIAITPYSSWTDGYTRRYEDGHWGNTCNEDDSYKNKKSDTYAWLDSVKDSYGKHSSKDTCDLAEAGNHMVGMSAHGALVLGKDKEDGGDYGWDWDEILKYYYDGVDINKVYE